MRVSPQFLTSITLTLFLFSAGCAVDPKKDKGASARYGDLNTWISAAVAHEQQGDLQRALFEYRVARTLAKRNQEVERSINRLESRISKKTEEKTKQGDKAVQQGKVSKARRLYLEALGLDPNNSDALAAMRRLDEKRSRLSMRKKVALSQRNYRSKRKEVKGSNGYDDEGYTYSRQAILQAESRPVDIEVLIAELKKHITKYPNDLEVRDLLSKTHLEQAEKAYQSEKYDDALGYLEQAGSVLNGDKKKLLTIAKKSKEYSKGLYLKGVRTSRSEPKQAVKYWEYALKFNPNDKRSRLRILNVNGM